MPTNPKRVVEVRYSPAEVERLAKVEPFAKAMIQEGYPIEYAIEYAQRFLTNPVFFGTQINDVKGRRLLTDPRKAALAVNWHLQTYQRGIVRCKDPQVLAPGKYEVREIQAPVWLDTVLSEGADVEIVALASEDSYVALSCYVDGDFIEGNELANFLCLALQFADDSRYDEYQDLFIKEARKYVKSRLHRLSLRRGHYSAELDDILNDGMLRILDQLFAYQKKLCGNASAPAKPVAGAKQLPQVYPLGPKISSYQKQIEKYLSTVADSVSKHLVRESKTAKGKPELGTKAKAAAAKNEPDWEEPAEEEDAQLEEQEIPEREEPEQKRPIRADQVFDLRKLSTSDPIRSVFLKQGISEIKKILPQALLKKLYMRSEYGSSLEEIAKEHRVTKGAIFKDFKNILKRAGPVAVRFLSGVKTVEQYSALKHSRRRRRDNT